MTIEQAIDDVYKEGFEAGKQSRWIPVSERLPEINEVCVLFIQNKWVVIGYRIGEAAFVKSDNTKIFGITHWQPIVPPKL
jgi:hypothetical protein